MTSDVALRHLVRYGTSAEKKYFTGEFSDAYDGIIINANMIAYTLRSITAFLGEKLPRKPFIIDPITHAFQHDYHYLLNDKDELKASFKKLAEYYGPPIDEIAGNETVSDRHFDDAGVRKEFCHNVIDFQNEMVKREAEQQGLLEYYKFANINIDSAIKPYAIIPPYFYMTPSNCSQWLDINVGFINVAREKLQNKQPIFAQLVIDQALLLASEKTKDLVDKYSNSDCDGLFLWVDLLSEHEVPLILLEKFIELLEGFQGKKEVYNAYGGYLSVLLTSSKLGKLLSGVCHGMEYGESRNIIPVGGGLPFAKFYYPALHKRLKYNQAVAVAKVAGGLNSPKEYRDVICDCHNCRAVINNNMENFKKYGESTELKFQRAGQMIRMSYPTSAAKDICLRHYLLRKKMEYNGVDDLDMGVVEKNFRESSEEFSPILGDKELSYLGNWSRIIKRLSGTPPY